MNRYYEKTSLDSNDPRTVEINENVNRNSSS